MCTYRNPALHRPELHRDTAYGLVGPWLDVRIGLFEFPAPCMILGRGRRWVALHRGCPISSSRDEGSLTAPARPPRLSLIERPQLSSTPAAVIPKAHAHELSPTKRSI